MSKNIRDEQFEATGTDTTWSTPTVQTTGSGTGNLDYATSGIGSPSTWDSQCFRCVASASGDTAFMQHDGTSDYNICYFRIEVYVDSHSLAAGEQAQIFYAWDSAYVGAFLVALYNQSGTMRFMMSPQVDAPGYYYSDNAINIDTRYVIEVKWDNTNNLWNWKIGGVQQEPSDISFTTDVGIDYYKLGIVSTNNAAVICIDNFAMDTTGWIGEEISDVYIPIQVIG